jgi:phosphodiesterase/alkaline phosphatase D-like protein
MEVICGPIVRRTTPSTATLWLELSNDCVVAGRAKLSEAPPGVKAARTDWIRSDVRRTVSVDQRFYVILTFEDLQPGAAYFYRFYVKVTDGRRDVMDVERMKWANVPGVDYTSWPELEATIPELFSPTFDLKRLAARGGLPEFRTLPAAGQEESRIAFGSCRKRDAGHAGKTSDKGADVLKLFGQDLRARPSSRLKDWPQFLLLIGDQIYADDIDAAVVKSAGIRSGALPSLDVPPAMLTAGMKAGTDGFQCGEYAHFAESYVHAFTDPDVRFLFANLAVFMMFDDHDITDDWNITRGWLEQALKNPDWTIAIREGLIAYWMYQGWGNPLPAAGWSDPRLKVLIDAADGGYDALEPLRKVISPQPGQFDYYYTIESDPRVAMLDARHDRNFVKPASGDQDTYVDVNDQILSDKQWTWLEKQTQAATGPVIIVTSAPLLQFPWADLAFLETVRSEGGIVGEFEQNRINSTEAKRRELDADSWAAFPSSFLRITEILSRGGPFVFLSGDVHYSYVNFGRVDLPHSSDFASQPLLLHAVSSPLRNQWSGETIKSPVKRGLVFESPSMDALDQIRKATAARASAKPPQPYSAKASLFTLRVFYPNPVAGVFTKDAAGPFGDDYTYFNNIGQLQIAQDRKSAKVRWLAATSDPKTPLQAIGEFATPKGSLVR